MKKNNFFKIGLTLLVAALVTFGACKKKELIKIIGIIQGVAYDGNTNEALDGVTATWMVNGEVKTATANTNGYTASDLPPGEYYLTFTKEGYTTVVANEFIDRDRYTGDERTVSGGDNYYETHTVNPIMYPLNGALKGTILKQKNGLTSPAEGVVVYITYQTPATGGDANDSRTQGITPNVYADTTDTNGEYNFENVPATAVTISTATYNDGVTDFGTYTANATLTSGATINMAETTLNIVDAIPQVASANFANNQKIDVDENIIISFSKEVDQSSFEATLNNGAIDVSVSWSKAISTVTINPDEILNPGTGYNLSVTGKSTDGLDFAYNFVVTTVDGIAYQGSNLYNVEGNPVQDFAVGSDITVDFNIEPNQEQTEAKGGYFTLYFDQDEDGNVNYNDRLDATVSYSGKVITLNPTANLQANKQYVLMYNVYSEYESNNTFKTIIFKTKSDLTAPGQITGFTIDMGEDWTANFNTTDVNFEFNRVTGAEYYELWAKDNNKNQNYVYLGRVFDLGDYDQTATQNTMKSLPATFDYYEDDGIQTPFSHGTVITYKMKAVNDAGEGAWSSTIDIKDETEITSFQSVSQSETSNNSGGTSSVTVEITCKANTGEYFDTSSVPQFDVDFVWGDELDPSDISYTWTDHQELVISFTVPASTNYSGNDIEIDNFKDSSGNEVSTKIVLNIW